MKYPDPKLFGSLTSCSREVSEFMYGINDDSGELAGKDDVLKESVNMEFAGETFRTRKGFYAKEESRTVPGFYDNEVYIPFTVSDTVCFLNSKPLHIACCCTGDISEATLYFSLVDSEGNISPAGNIVFPRASSEQFFIPQSVFFITTQKIRGSGVFAFVYRKSGAEVICEIYEAANDFSDWLNVSDSCYVPIISINGRGEDYDMAVLNGGVSFPDPRRLEELNLLTGKYKCYFTSDGFSAYFRLPYGNLPDISSLNCRIYTAPDEYTEWTIGALSNHCYATLLGETVHLYLDRTLGILRFWKSPENYSVPYMERCKLNNIVVTAYTDNDEFFESIMSSKASVSLDNHIYCYGNALKSNCVFCAKTTTPLYFPKSSKLFLGDGATPVTALRVQNGKLIAFKPGETYRITTSSENDDGKEIDLPEATAYLKGDVLRAQTIDNGIGCSNASTIRLCGSRLVWLSSDGAVYALATTTYGNTTNIFRVSQPLGSRLKGALADAQTVFAVTNGGQYLLFVDKTVFVMNHRSRAFGYAKAYYAHDDDIKSPAWYVWTLPEGMAFTGGAVVDGAPILTSFLSDNLSYYISVQGNDCTDSFLSVDEGDIVTVSQPVHSGFKTKLFDLSAGRRFKRLDRLLLYSHIPCHATLTLSDGKKQLVQKINLPGDFDYLSLPGGIPNFALLSVSLFSEEPLNIGSVLMICKTLSKKV